MMSRRARERRAVLRNWLRGSSSLGWVPVVALAAAAALPEPASAQTSNISVETENVLTLLQPFLNLNSTAVGQQTLTANLQQAVLINQNTSNTAILNSASQINPNGPSATLLNGNLSTGTLAALAISDENSLGASSTELYGTTIYVGPAANIAGALPTQNTTGYTFSNGASVYTNGAQQYGAFGAVLGQAYVNGVNPSGVNSNLTATVALLTDAFCFTGNLTSNTPTYAKCQGDISVSKSYFANGTIDNATPAQAPNGTTLPTSTNGALPSTTSSVYDTAYGVTNGANVTNSTTSQYGTYKQNAYGDSHPYQTYGAVSSSYTLYDPTVAYTATGGTNPDKPSANAAFPSAHMSYAMTDALLLGMLVPQFYQSTLLRASEIGESRIVVGVHYPTDIIGSRAAISYDLAQFLSNPAYATAAVTGSTGNGNTTINMPALFTAAQPGLQSYLNANTASCGGTIAACAANTVSSPNPYAPSTTNAEIYEARLTYGLPIDTFAQAPREQAPAGGPDASILLATLYGGSTAAAQTLAPTGGIYGSLQTSTINQIIVNTETNALAAFYGTALSYWSRINLYAAAGYFGGVTGTITLASSDQVNTNVVVASQTTNVNGDIVPAGVLAGTGTITASTGTAVQVQSGGTFAPGTPGTTPGTMTVNGTLGFASGGFYQATVGGTSASRANVSGTASLTGGIVEATFASLPTYNTYDILHTGGLGGTNFASVTNTTPNPNYALNLGYTTTDVNLNVVAQLGAGSGAQGNQQNVGNAISYYFNDGPLPGSFPFLFTLTGSALTTALTQLDGEVATDAESSAFTFMNEFLRMMSGDSVVGASAGAGTRAPGFTDEEPASLPEYVALAYAGVLKAQPKPAAFDQRWTAWGSSFGGSEKIDGDAVEGSNTTRVGTFGFAGGMDYHVAPGTVYGFALAGGGTDWSLAQNLGSGRSDAFAFGVHGITRSGPAYLAGTLAFANHWMTTDRTAALGDQLRATFDAQSYAARAEAGYRYAVTPTLGVTPYAALQVQDFHIPSYSENDLTGGGFGLSYASKDATDTRSELGARFDDPTLLGTTPLVLRARVAWAHDWVSTASLTAAFETLPGTSFVVNGAPLPHDSALTSAGGDLYLNASWTLSARFDGEFANNAQTYAGTGTLRYTW